MPLTPDILNQTTNKTSFTEDAKQFIPNESLETAIETAITVGEPLLITGETGTGKTQSAYYTAYKLNIEPVLHFQVKSTTTATDILYNFNTVQYFHDAHFQRINIDDEAPTLDKNNYIEERPLWQAIKKGDETGKPAVLLIDEIDKAPRDFPNDLLHELDKMEFYIQETKTWVKSKLGIRPIVIITSNSERRLPEPFLRRCVFHHIQFDNNLIEKIISTHMQNLLSDELIALALKRFRELRGLELLRKKPATGELLVWLRMLAVEANVNADQLENQLRTKDLSKLPYLGILLKDQHDIKESGG